MRQRTVGADSAALVDPAVEEQTSSRRLLPTSSPVLAVCGFSGSGKTTLLEAAIPQLVVRGLSVAVVNHSLQTEF